MNNMKKNCVRAAVLAALAFQPCVSEAVHVSPGGQGQVLLFPYYTVRGGYNTLISVTNTQENSKVLKVRFLEGKNGREVMDFNLFLSPNDTWTGAVVATAAGARVITNDNSCVTPSDVFTETRTDPTGLAINAFKNYGYTGTVADSNVATFASLDRTREGFFEVIEMGVLDASSAAGNAVIGNLKQNCSALDSYDGFVGNPSVTRFPNVGGQLMLPPRGGLVGRASLIRTDNGSNFTYGATALDAWSSVIAYAAAGDPGPSLADAVPAISQVLTPDGAVTSNWSSGRDAVSAALMRYTLQSEFVLDAGTASLTDWMVTFPTKRYYVDAGPGSARVPFASNFSNTTTNGACDAFTTAVFDREGNAAPSALSGQLCWTASVVPFGSSSLAAALNTSPVSAGAQQFINSANTTPGANVTPALKSVQGPNGQLTMRFDGGPANLLPASATLTPAAGAPRVIPGRTFGLPAIGFMIHNYQNTGVQARYGGVIAHTFSSRVE